MNENLNLVEILKDCPEGTKLYSTIYGDVELVNVLQGENVEYPIEIKLNNNIIETFTNGGRLLIDYDGECTLFPSKEQRDWSKFNPKKKELVSPYEFKNGDIVATNTELQVFILQRAESDKKGYCYIGYDFKLNVLFLAGKWRFDRLATEEEKQKLFDAIKLNGYKWNPETKTLEKLIKSKFDPNTLKPFDKVLARDYFHDEWMCTFFSHIRENSNSPYVGVNLDWRCCIPYNDETKHLVGTTEEAPEYYRYWED